MFSTIKRSIPNLAILFWSSKSLAGYRKSIKLLIIILSGIVLAAGSVQAKELYVDSQTGNDSVSYANNSADSPWRTLGRAVWGSTDRSRPSSSEAAQAGDTVIVEAGIYDATGPGGARYYPYYNPANSGTPGNYITFQANGSVELRSSHDDPRALIGSYQRNYIIWDGFALNENYMVSPTDTGPVVAWACSYVILKNLHVTGIDQNSIDTNHNAIRIEESNHITVENCYLTGFNDNGNASGVTTYRSSYITLQHNEVVNSFYGLWVKGANPGPFTIRNNYIHGCTVGVAFGGLRAGGADVYQNVILDALSGFYFTSYASDGPQNVNIVNNTVVSNSGDYAIYLKDNYGGLSNIVLRNNIFAESSGAGIYVIQSDIFEDLDSDHNNYNNTNDCKVSDTGMTLSTWQSRYSQDLNSFVSNPEFINAGNLNYRIDSGSPCEGNGIDLLDLDGDGVTNDSINIGAYVTGNEVIGITTAPLGGGDGGTAAPLLPPTNLRIN